MKKFARDCPTFDDEIIKQFRFPHSSEVHAGPLAALSLSLADFFTHIALYL